MSALYNPVMGANHSTPSFFVHFSLSVFVLGLFVATSIAQVNFTRQTHDPILSPGDHGSWDDGFIYQSTVIRKGSLYEMWYEGGPDHGPRHIGYARSPDGVNWIKDPNNPALSPGDSSAWDEGTVAPGTVIFDGTIYHMWYFGFDDNDQVHGVGYASSTSGLTWTKHQNNPVLSTGDHDAFDHHAVHWPSVVHDGTTYHMWYGGETGNHDIPAAIGYATSPDGVVWTKHANNPRLEAGHHDAWDGHWARQPAVVFDGTTFHMFYHGASGLASAIGYARSSDGMNWKKFSGNPIMEAGPHGSWDDFGVTNAAVMLVGDTFKMWYTGVGGGGEHHDVAQGRVGNSSRVMQKATGQSQLVFQIGLATAPVSTAEPVIEAIADVPHDQGNQVRVIWNGSLFDGLDDTETVIEYNLWRYVEARPHGKAATRQADEQVGLKMAAAKGDGRAVELNGILWDFVATIPVHRNARYAYVAPTLSNTTETDTVANVFMVSAHTADPSVYFDSVPAAGFSVDNLAPAAPTNLIAREAEVGGISAVVLSWDESADSDFAFFAIYKDNGLGPLAKTTQLSYTDTMVTVGHSPNYEVSAVDVNGNEGERTQVSLIVTAVVDNPNEHIPSGFALHQNYPNPFNPVTEIAFEIPEAAKVVLTIYNIFGEEVRKLVDQELPQGMHRLSWNAKNNQGNPVSSGVYVYKMQAGDFSHVRKMSLLR